MNFAHLHLHTQYSLLDGANKVKEVIKTAALLGQPAIAITDHGNMHGAVEFFTTAQKNGIKPIIGCELYVAPANRRQRGGSEDKSYYHLTAIAMNQVGYQNLCRLVSLAYKEGFYYKPRVDKELLSQYNEGIIILSGCLGSEIGYLSRHGNIEGAKKVAEFFTNTFKNRFYFEVQPHKIVEQATLNNLCCELAVSMGIPLVATTDCHYCLPEDHLAQEVLMCISTGKNINDPSRMRHEGVNLHLKNGLEMLSEFNGFKYAESSIAESVAIASLCNVSFDFATYHMPRFSEESNKAHDEQMATIARNGLKSRFPEIDPQYHDRLEEEIRLINKMGFASYFLVVSDFIVWAKENGVAVGPGRGSVAGSLVAYAMRITEVDPIKHGLLFERFLNPDRISLPDIDVDFCVYGRDRVIDYVRTKYGSDKVAQIATFGTLKAKAAIKDVGRVLGVSYAETDRLAQLIPAPRQGFDYSLTEALEMEPRLKEYAGTTEGQHLITLALKLEGLTRHSSTHAAGLVIGDKPLMDMLPMMVDKDGADVTQFPMGDVEKIGLVKFDFLGLKTLTVLRATVEIISRSRGITIDLNEISLYEREVYQQLSLGQTVGVFQLESSGITEMTMRLKPNTFDDLVAILALYRPGPLDAGMVDRYIERKHNREKVIYLHPQMEPTLRSTYGIMLYQEQIMQLARVLAGYSLAEADLLRKAMGKKNPEEMAKQKSRFLMGAEKNGIGLVIAEEIFSQMETFARYGFNRSHSVAYAMISYQTAYLKTYYQVEFMAALMTLDRNDSDKTLKNMTECRRQGIAVLPPDVNDSDGGFSVSENNIRFGLEAIKGLGEKAVLAIINARKSGLFKNIEDFLTRVDPRVINKKVLENLIGCGAFDYTSVSRRELNECIEELLKSTAKYHEERLSGQMGLFSGNELGGFSIVRPRRNLPEWSNAEKLQYEKATLGFYITGHPLERYRVELTRLGAVSTIMLKEGRVKNKTEVEVAGVVTALRLRNTKKGDRYASFSLEDEVGTIDSLVWPDTYRSYGDLLTSELPLIFTGRADLTDERSVLIVEKVSMLSELKQLKAKKALLNLDSGNNLSNKLLEMKVIFDKYPGNCPLFAHCEIEGNPIKVALPIYISPSDKLCVEIESINGVSSLIFLQ
jgi:DNA polymerase III subunit alpha